MLDLKMTVNLFFNNRLLKNIDKIVCQEKNKKKIKNNNSIRSHLQIYVERYFPILVGNSKRSNSYENSFFIKYLTLYKRRE